ncbi:MAG: hypothetical protein JWN85_4855 [Gammaproteobacteria bacterium]|nr:hypothetical protein [Gammaproteobacteria bacterium]
MSSLTHLQNDFQSFLLRGDAAVEAHVVGTDRVPIATRLGIYGDGYCARLIEALQTNFPVLTQLLGEGDFDTLATAYVRTHESPFFSIRYYGNALADFLAAEADYAGAPVLAELARWEWTMTEVFDAADAMPIGADDLGRVAPAEWADLCFDWHPSVRRLELAWNAPQIWKAVTEDAEIPEVTLHPQPVQWLLWRHELRSYFRSLPSAEALVLEAARAGQPFGELCLLLCAQFGAAEAPARAASFLRDWVGSGLLTAVR